MNGFVPNVAKHSPRAKSHMVTLGFEVTNSQRLVVLFRAALDFETFPLAGASSDGVGWMHAPVQVNSMGWSGIRTEMKRAAVGAAGIS